MTTAAAHRSLDAWDRNPVATFAAFVATPEFVLTSSRQRDIIPIPVSNESAAIYRFMFGKFAAWMLEQRLTMSRVGAADLQRFIGHKTDGKPDLNSKIAYRYLRLLERCYDWLERAPNPAREAIAATDRAHLAQDAPMTALTAEELQRFLAALPAGRDPEQKGHAGWKRRRDRAMQVVMALAGLRVAEAVGLLVSEIGRQTLVDGGLELNITPEHKHRTSYEHTTVLPREGVAELLAWLDERAELKIPGDLAFPASLEGEPLHKATVYRQVKASFARAGISPARAGGRTLRNTFASQQWQQGTPADEMTTLLGVALERSAQAYKYARTGTPAPGSESAGPDEGDERDQAAPR
jgi:site-specific recombinase XerD